MPHRPYHHGDLREQILSHAITKIESDGLSAVTLRELARECGVSPSAPQRHFPTKDDLLTALAVRGYGHIEELVSKLKLDLPVDKALTKFARAYIAYVLEHPTLIQLMYTRLFEVGAKEVDAAFVRAFAPVDSLLERARDSGEIIDDLPLASTMVRITMRGLATSFSTGALDVSDKTLAAKIVGALVSGLRPR